MKLYAVRIFVKDWEQACIFYGDTLNLPVKFKDASAGWAEFDVGGPSLGLERITEADPEAPRLTGRFLAVSFSVDDITVKYQELVAQGVTFIEPPTKQAWGGTLAHFQDPEGNILTLLG